MSMSSSEHCVIKASALVELEHHLSHVIGLVLVK
jgi:hypothetical protein